MNFDQLVPAISLIAVLILVLPAFLKTNSKLKVYDFKLKELPALTKLLTLASLQGIAD